jgi:hypothetical protein
VPEARWAGGRGETSQLCWRSPLIYAEVFSMVKAVYTDFSLKLDVKQSIFKELE